MLNEAAKNRLKLWLRSERAMGLSGVGPMSWKSFAPQAVEQIPAQVPHVVAAQSQTTINSSLTTAGADEPRFEPIANPLTAEERCTHLTQLDEMHVRGCTKCHLCNTRSKTVFGEGAVDARLMFIGEGPGSKEDQTGRPFVGPAGELLNRMIGAMGLKREQVYIANIIKCRAYHPGPPPKDRAPSPEEVAACSPYLQRQVDIIRPSVIVTLGLPATQFVLQTKNS